MRILHLGKFYPPARGGMENFHHDLARQQQRAGHQVLSLVHQESPGVATAHEEIDGSPVIRVKIVGRPVHTPLAPGLRFELKKAIQDFRPDVIHHHVPNASSLLALTVREARQVPWVLQWQSDIVRSRLDWRLSVAYPFYAPFERALLKRASAVLVASPPYLESSATLRPFHAKCRVSGLGVDPERVPEPEAAALEAGERRWRKAGLRVLAVGRLSYYKGFEYLMRAVAECADTQLVLVGSGEQEGLLRGLVQQLQLQHRVQMLGGVDDELLRGLYKSCDCLSLPSIERTEAFGLVLVEAMRYGKPVLATSIPGSGVGWVVRNEENGLLVPPADSAGLAAGLRRLAEDSGLRERLGRTGAVTWAERFSIAAVERRINELYAEVGGAG